MIASIRTVVFLFFGLVATAASAQNYPGKVVKIIVPYGPAGISDIAARTIGAKLSTLWKQSVVVENRVGGAGVIGTSAVANAAPDGYTLLVATVAEFTVSPHLGKQTFNIQKDFVPIMMLTDTPLMLVAHASAPFNNVRELVAYAKTQPGGVSFASPGIGTLNHLTGEHFGSATGAKMVHVPYKGGGQAAAAIASGEVPLGVAGVTVVAGHIDAGRIKAIGVASEQRIKTRADWPTMIEAGIPDFVASNWVAMAAPAGTPADVLAKINADVNQVLKMPEVRDQLVKIGADPVGGPPEVLAARIRKDSERYRKVIEQINLKLD
jgi:tripartite-type tricarboxylate transporter receptor subunit TctC